MNPRKRYLRARSWLAAAGLAMVIAGWMVGDFCVHRIPDQRLIAVAWVATIAGVFGGPVVIVVGNVILWRKYH